MKIKTMLAAALFAVTTHTAMGDEISAMMQGPKLMFPNRFEYQLYMDGQAKGWPLQFECNYTTKTCLLGYGWRDNFTGVVLADDRKTILRHISCGSGGCINYDTGIFSSRAGDYPWEVSHDYPRSCVEAVRDHNEYCDLSVVPVGSKWGIESSVYRCKDRYAENMIKECVPGRREVVTVEKVDGVKTCVRPTANPEGSNCAWVYKSNLITLSR